MVRDTVPTGDPRLILNAHVSKIDWGGKGVTVSTKDGRTFNGKHVISTVSLGVIRKHHQELFSPALPAKQSQALMNNHMPMCNLTHVLIQFPSVWWDNSVPAWVSANDGGEANKGLFTAWHNLNADNMIPGSKTILSFLGEPEASEYESMPPAELARVITDRVRKQHPDIKIPDGVTAWLKNWGLDPLTYGAYAYAEPKVSWRGEWKKPLKKDKTTKVRFAGEATCGDLDGYTHGALQSGKEAAAWYLHEAGKGPNPNNDDSLSLCGW
jgi:monoamine oxidase